MLNGEWKIFVLDGIVIMVIYHIILFLLKKHALSDAAITSA
jgi:hypothetical protein